MLYTYKYICMYKSNVYIYILHIKLFYLVTFRIICIKTNFIVFLTYTVCIANTQLYSDSFLNSSENSVAELLRGV